MSILRSTTQFVLEDKLNPDIDPLIRLSPMHRSHLYHPFGMQLWKLICKLIHRILLIKNLKESARLMRRTDVHYQVTELRGPS